MGTPEPKFLDISHSHAKTVTKFDMLTHRGQTNNMPHPLGPLPRGGAPEPKFFLHAQYLYFNCFAEFIVNNRVSPYHYLRIVVVGAFVEGFSSFINLFDSLISSAIYLIVVCL